MQLMARVSEAPSWTMAPQGPRALPGYSRWPLSTLGPSTADPLLPTLPGEARAPLPLPTAVASVLCKQKSEEQGGGAGELQVGSPMQGP